jgi:hypothetical protein
VAGVSHFMCSYSELKGVLNSVRLRTPNGGLITELGWVGLTFHLTRPTVYPAYHQPS